MQNRTELLVALALVALTVATFWPVVGCEFVSYDDPDYVTSNPHVQQGLTPDSIAWAFSTGHAANWHPLTWLSLMLDHNLWKLDPRGYHFTNLLLHAANVALVFLMLRQMTGDLLRSALVAALFAVHPLRVESVAWVAERKDVLCAFFGLLAILAYTRYARAPSRGRYALVMLCFALSLLAKPMLVTLPVLLLLLDYWPLSRWQVQGANPARPHSTTFPERSPRALVTEKLPLVAVAVASSVITFWVQLQGKSVKGLDSYPWDARLANAAVSYLRYVEKMFRLDHLAVIYPHPGFWPEWLAITCAASLVVSVTFVVWRLRANPWLAVGWFWYLGLLVPVIGLVQVGLQSMADRYTYLPTIGLLIMLVWSLPNWLFRSQPGRIVLGIATAVCLVVLCLFTRTQIGTWKDSTTLFEHALAVTWDNYVAHDELGVVLANMGHPREALKQFDLAAKIRPQDAVIHFNRGNVYLALGDFPSALAEFERAVRLDPHSAQAYNGRGTADYGLRRFDQALVDYDQAIELQPDFADAYNGRGVAHSQLGQPREAMQDFAAAIRVNPDFAAAYINRGNAYAGARQFPSAIQDFDQAIRVSPHDANVFEFRGNAYGMAGRLDAAIADYTSAIELKPGKASAYCNRAIANYHRKQYAAAWKDVASCRKRGGQVDPNFIKLLAKDSGRSE